MKVPCVMCLWIQTVFLFLLMVVDEDLVLQNTQRSIKGHVIIYPQQPSKLAAILAPAIEAIISPVCVLFVGSSPPTPEWLRDHAKPLAVLEENPVLPFNIEHISNNVANETVTSRYDAVQSPDPSTNPSNPTARNDRSLFYESFAIVILLWPLTTFYSSHQTSGTPTPASKSAGLSVSQETLGSFDIIDDSENSCEAPPRKRSKGTASGEKGKSSGRRGTGFA
ncbi:hypothetical protein B0H14DRAFT_2574439 [Mycena olivaceomarginata]|nr:hypothetical protein B0H14DRAFT_2574439 [Mycena olivaceomarginata]